MSEVSGFSAQEWRRDYLLGPDMSARDADELLIANWRNYSAPDRYHHGVGHPTWMLNELDQQLDEVMNPRVLGWTIIYHDKRMNFLSRIPGENEEQSAIDAESDLAGKLPGIEVDLIGNNIRRSANHGLELDDQDLALFLDLDMAILGAPEPVYEQYRDNVRQEYGFAPLGAYRLGRMAFLRTVKDYGTQIFSTDWGLAKLEAPAHKNTQAEFDYWDKLAD